MPIIGWAIETTVPTEIDLTVFLFARKNILAQNKMFPSFRIYRWARLVSLWASIFLGHFAGSLNAAPINPDNILVAIGQSTSSPHGTSFVYNAVRECTLSGQTVQTIPFQYRDQAYPATEFLHDIVVDQSGSLYGFNGTFDPFLTRYFADSQTFTHKAFPEWSLINSTMWGGIAAYGNYIFATDASTFYDFRSGIIRFDVASNKVVHFADGNNEFSDLNVGLDGKLYALVYSGALISAESIHVYDPVSLAFIKEIPIPASVSETWIRNIAVDKIGRIFLSGENGTIYRLDQAGQLNASKSTGYTTLTDMDVDESGRLLIGQEEGRVILGNTSLVDNFTSFLAVSDPNVWTWTFFVSFAHATPVLPGPVPTPAPTPVPTPSPEPKHDILVSLGKAGFESLVRQFTPRGAVLRNIAFEYRGDEFSSEMLGDIVVDENGFIYGYNGTSYPLLTRYSDASGTFTHRGFAGWNNFSNANYGGIASYGSFIFLTDIIGPSDGGPNGIIRFDTSTDTFVRAGEGIDF